VKVQSSPSYCWFVEQLIKATEALEAILCKTVHKLPLGTSIVVVRVGTFVEELVIVWNVVRNGKSEERNGRCMNALYSV